MSGHGTLNGQPVGPNLPDPIPCERCGHPIWLADSVVAYVRNHVLRQDERHELQNRPWELSPLLRPGSPWSLQPHVCRPVRKVEGKIER